MGEWAEFFWRPADGEGTVRCLHGTTHTEEVRRVLPREFMQGFAVAGTMLLSEQIPDPKTRADVMLRSLLTLVHQGKFQCRCASDRTWTFEAQW